MRGSTCGLTRGTRGYRAGPRITSGHTQGIDDAAVMQNGRFWTCRVSTRQRQYERAGQKGEKWRERERNKVMERGQPIRPPARRSLYCTYCTVLCQGVVQAQRETWLLIHFHTLSESPASEEDHTHKSTVVGKVLTYFT